MRFISFLLIATVLVNGVATASASCASYIVVRRLGRRRDAALVSALGFAIASAAWGWATAFFGYALAGALAFIVFALTVVLLENR